MTERVNGLVNQAKTVLHQNNAHQLHKLLENNGEKPPYILVGHSMGGLIIEYSETYIQMK